MKPLIENESQKAPALRDIAVSKPIKRGYAKDSNSSLAKLSKAMKANYRKKNYLGKIIINITRC